MKIVIIGFGYWGEIILKTLKNLKGIDYLCVVDKNPDQKKKAKGHKIDFFNDINQALKQVECVIIATWENTHYWITKKCLLEKKHVLVEKPLALSFKQAQELVKLAKKNNSTLMVDSTFMFDKSFLLLKERIKKGQIGELQQIDSFRFSCNVSRPWSNVVMDLLPHDIAIFYALLKKEPQSLKVVNFSRLFNKQIDNAQIAFGFGSVIANSFLSWTTPLNRREMIFYGDRGVFVWQKEDADTDVILRFKYRPKREVDLKERIIMKAKKKTLENALEEFFQSIRNRRQPLTSGEEVLPEVKILEKVLNLI